MQSSGGDVGMNFMVAVDGSPAAHLGFQVVMESLLHTADRITVGHIFNKEKSYLPYDQQPEALNKTYETLTISLGTRSSLLWEERDGKTSTKEQMVSMAAKAQSSLLVVGMHGRKGPKM